MNARILYDTVSARMSKLTTRAYSTSFSLGISFLHKRFHAPIYGIYGFVRLADEIVDTFHEHDKEKLLADFRLDTYKAIEERISLNPILNSFQKVVHNYQIENELIDTFLESMAMDLRPMDYNSASFKNYILGSAEVVGLMCLRVFTEGNTSLYEQLKPAAMDLGSAFQKVNFLRDLRDDFEHLGRSYFPNVDLRQFDTTQKALIEADILADFERALKGIKALPRGARMGVYLAYIYYKALFRKIQQTPSHEVLRKRIRIPNNMKFRLMIGTYIRHSFNLI